MHLHKSPNCASQACPKNHSHIKYPLSRCRVLHPPCAAGKQEQAAADSTQDVIVSQALTAIGLSGTIAVSGAAICGINLLRLFHWERLQDIQLAVELNSILLLLDAALFLPSYGIPKSLLDQQQGAEEQQQQMRQQQQQQQQQQFLDMSALAACSAWDISSWQLMFTSLQEALRRPQQQQLPLPVSAGLLVGRESVKELLQRGFFLTALAGWLADRLYEADVGGLEGLVALPGGVQATIPQLGLLAASLAATVVFAPTAFLAAEEAAQGVSGAMLLQTEAGSAAAAAAAVVGGRQQGKASSSSSSSTQRQQQQGQQQGSMQQVGAQDAAEGQAGDENEAVDPEVLEYRLLKGTQACLVSAPTQLAYRITLAKELGRLMLANVMFVATQQNLAASFSSGVLANALLLLYGRRPLPKGP